MTVARSRLCGAWLDDIPTQWSSAQIRRVARFRNGVDYKAVEVESGGYPVYGSGGEFRRSSKYLYDGTSVLFGRKGTVDRPLLVHGRFWTVDTMFFTELGPDIEPRFFHYYATTMPFDYYRTSTAVPSMTQEDLASHVMPLPSLKAQIEIADYLDRETAQIDTLIAKQETLIERLHGRRQAVIEHDVSASIDPFAATRGNSAHIGAHFDVTLGKMLDAGKARREEDTDLPYIRAANIQDAGLDLRDVNSMPYSRIEAATLDLRAGDLLVVEGGAVGTSVVLGRDMPGWSFQKTVNRVRARGSWSTRWLSYVLRSYRDAGVIEVLCNGSTIQHLTAEKLRALRVPIIDPDEQRRIVAHLDEQTAKIDALIAKAERFIELAKERRAALITAAVTGRLDVTAA